MLSQTRPKSQPPLKFNGQSSTRQSQDHWDQLIERYQVVEGAQKLSLQKIPDELEVSSSSSASTSSSSSSLASSSLSLSTTSSTSTVLAALSTMQVGQRNKSMIARYSAPVTDPTTSNTIAVNRSKAAHPADDVEEDEASTSSSSSGSSGLSSMNSSSQHSHDSYSGPANDEIKRPPQQPAADKEVERCLSELVDSVVEQADNQIEYKTFKIHEAVPAKTRSITSSGSSDEDATDCVARVLPETRFVTGERKLYEMVENDDFVSEVHIVRILELHDSSSAIDQARNCIGNALRQTKQTHELSWSVSLSVDQALIEWRQLNGGKSHTESLSMDQVSDCFIDRELVVWLITNLTPRGCRSDAKQPENAPVGSELETTLDDIALALDEPIDSYGKNTITIQPVTVSSAEIERAVVWLCSSESEAKQFQETFQEFKGKQSKKKTQQTTTEQSSRSISQPKQPVDTREINDHTSFLSERSTNDLSSSGARNNRQEQQQVKSFEKSDSTSNSIAATSNGCNGERMRNASTKTTRVSDHRMKQTKEDVARELDQETPVAEVEEEKPTINKQMKSTQRADELNKFPTAHADEFEAKSSKLTGELKRQKKSVSGLDLSRASTSSSNLATYYRNVASKVFSNGQSKIKSFKDEMIKFNNRMPTSASAKRNSIAVQSSDRSTLQVSGSVNNLSLLADCESIDHQQRSSSNRPLNHVPKATSSANAGAAAAQVKVDQTPVIKPRTSILKNKHSEKNGAQCDINNNYIRNDHQVNKQQGLQQQQQQQESRQQTSISKRNSDEKEQFRSQKPKSILKSGKSSTTTSPAIEERSQLLAKNISNGSHKSALSSGRKEVKQLVADVDNIQQPKSCLKSELHAPKRHTTSDNLERRMSAFPRSSDIGSQVTRRSEKLLAPEDESEENQRSNRDQAFERLRQRASCYDISRLMSKHGLQSQLNELRSGSSNSIAGKSRQRRPALLLADNKCDFPSAKAPPAEQERDDDDGDKRILSDKVAANVMKTTTSGADGTVRAKVSVAQLKPSLEDLDWVNTQGGYSSTNISAQIGRRQQQQQMAASLARDNEELSAQRAKKSEFDPRTLKKPTQSVEPKELKDKVEFTTETASSSEEDSSVEDEEPSQVTSSSLSKSGPFNLLRQSFNQKTLSSMLKFSGRASLRIKAAPVNRSGESSNSEKAKAIAIAEANLLAAKQLKQQAQKLKEQQKREQQQQAAIDPTAMMLAAVHYNQQIQRQQQHQQQQQQQQQHQQILYQQAQQYAVAARGQMFDASGVHMQHQMLIQRQQQQQQMAYMASHYMAQQMAVMQSASPMLPIGAIPPSQPLMYVQPSIPMQSQQQSAGVFKKSILKGSKVTPAPAIMYPTQAPSQHMIPMSVNHHSSFNIVYGSSSASQIPQIQQQSDEITTVSQPPLAKHTSLGASMRKTVKSILINRSSFLSTSNQQTDAAKISAAAEPKLKSVLKTSGSRDIVLNSEGSDGDGSSSDSTTTYSKTGAPLSSSRSQVAGMLPKSALKKTSIQREPSSASSDSSCSSTSGPHRSSLVLSGSDNTRSTLTRASEYRQSVKVNGDHYSNPTSTRASKRGGPQSASARKNVTFSTKLTSIL